MKGDELYSKLMLFGGCLKSMGIFLSPVNKKFTNFYQPYTIFWALRPYKYSLLTPDSKDVLLQHRGEEKWQQAMFLSHWNGFK